MNTLPLFFKLENRPVLIIGGGDVALRKADLLDKAGAVITFVAPHYEDRLVAQFGTESSNSRHTLITDVYHEKYLDKQTIVIACTNDKAVNEQIFTDCEARFLPVNVVDNPPLCTFIFPAIIDRDPITIAVSSSGKAPVLARLLRAKIETMIPPQYGKLAGLAGRYRDKVKQALPNVTARRKFWEEVFEGNIGEAVLAEKLIENELVENVNSLSKTEQSLEALLQRHTQANQQLSQPVSQASNQEKLGKVYIVGAGAGDPDLLTFKALRYMQRADIVFYDNLVSPQILDLCRRDATKIYVGKKASNHAVAQADINALLVKHAKQGKRVLRLKGGDPYVFGRGGEEAEALVEAGVDFEVVAGITSAIAGASGAGIPLTHRDYAQSVKFVTACLKTDSMNDNFADLLDDTQTVVFYMGLKQLDRLTQGLIKAGKKPTTPIAIVSNASLPNQQVLTGTLTDIVEKQAVANLPAPALLIMGNVVTLHEKLAK
ncbi:MULTISPECIES: siroheme synthase CysG [unclassified Moraxella]|uniref:siroheme synthase CysG n=1 Tax=unclassified Moraxella TaxID=2685852 RepID=UPI003AF550B1